MYCKEGSLVRILANHQKEKNLKQYKDTFNKHIKPKKSPWNLFHGS